MNGIFLKICVLVCLVSMVPTAVATVGGPDGYGYTFDDSVTYDWIDIKNTGTQILSDDDDSSVRVPIGFTFEFYGTSLEFVDVMNNGIIADISPTPEYTWVNPPLENNLLADYNIDMLISPYWDDLSTDVNNDAIYYQTIGTEPNRKFVIEWYANHQYGYETLSGITFEVILYEGSNDIKYQYKNLKFGDVEIDNGAGATVGIKGNNDPNLNYFLEYSYDTASLSKKMAILFSTHDYAEIPTDASHVTSVTDQNCPQLDRIIGKWSHPLIKGDK